MKILGRVLYPPCPVRSTAGFFRARACILFTHPQASTGYLRFLMWGKRVTKGRYIYIKEQPKKCVGRRHTRVSSSKEMVCEGRMVLSLIGREDSDPTTPHSCYQWELLAQPLTSLVAEGLIEEEKVDSFNAPYYAPCPQEITQEIEKEGSRSRWIVFMHGKWIGTAATAHLRRRGAE